MTLADLTRWIAELRLPADLPWRDAAVLIAAAREGWRVEITDSGTWRVMRPVDSERI